MSDAITLIELLKELPAASATTGLSMLLVNSSGGLSKLSLNNILINRGNTSDLNEATMLGIYTPATKTVLNAPEGISVNTSDTIMCVGNTPNYFEQLYIPLFSASILKRSFRGASGGGWSGWIKFVPEA